MPTNTGRLAVVICAVMMLAGCGGGISGSGNGGGTPAPGSKLPPIGYHIENLPPVVAAAIPDSLLVASATEVDRNEPVPVAVLSASMLEVTEKYVNFGLVQLYADAAWQQIIDFCEGIVSNDPCDLAGAGIVVEYTRDMAIWETLLRNELFYQISSEVAGAGIDEIPDLHEIVEAKIDTTIELEVGTFVLLSDTEYDFEVSLVLPGPDSDGLMYRLLWADDASLVQAVVTDDSAVQKSHFLSIYRPSTAEKNESQQVISASRSAQGRNEIQFNQYQFPGEPEVVFLESQVRLVDVTGKTEIYSRGQVDGVGGFLSSETVTEDTQSSSDVELQRELFGESGSNYSYSVCDVEVSADRCTTQQDWNLIHGTEPTDSDYFLPQSELSDLGGDFRTFDLTISEVLTDAESYLLLKRDDLTISITSAGVQATIPGLGTFSWPPTDEELANLANNSTLENIATLNNAFLCRVIPSSEFTEQEFRTFCTGREDELTDALVISELYEKGEFRIQWESNAKIVVNNR